MSCLDSRHRVSQYAPTVKHYVNYNNPHAVHAVHADMYIKYLNRV